MSFGYDTIKIIKRMSFNHFLSITNIDEWKTIRQVNNYRTYICYKHNIRRENFTIILSYTKKIQSLSIEFSMSKLHLGNNYNNYNPIEHREAIIERLNNELENIICINLREFRCSRIDIALNIIVKNRPVYYLNVINEITRNSIGKLRKDPDCFPSIYYRNDTQSFQVYDKTTEQQRRNRNINGNIIRLENQIKTSPGIHNRFGRVFFYDLFELDTYNQIIECFKKTFYNILPHQERLFLTNQNDLDNYLKNLLNRNYTHAIICYYYKVSEGLVNIQETFAHLVDCYYRKKATRIFYHLQILLNDNVLSRYSTPILEIIDSIENNG